jgi:hypothetical protein
MFLETCPLEYFKLEQGHELDGAMSGIGVYQKIHVESHGAPWYTTIVCEGGGHCRAVSTVTIGTRSNLYAVYSCQRHGRLLSIQKVEDGM